VKAWIVWLDPADNDRPHWVRVDDVAVPAVQQVIDGIRGRGGREQPPPVGPTTPETTTCGVRSPS